MGSIIGFNPEPEEKRNMVMNWKLVLKFRGIKGLSGFRV